MGITNSNKELSVSQIECGGSLGIRLSLTAAPDITANPTDIVLILDRSGSLAGEALENMQNGAKTIIDIVDEATDSAEDGQIGLGSRIAIVSFADTATQDTQLITSVAELKAAVDGLTSEGSSNQEDAFTQALALFDPNSENAKVIVIFTDGITTAGGDANTVAAAAKAQGVTIYAIGLSGDGNINEQALRDWASDPDSAYVAITPNDAELEELFRDLAGNITNPGATNVIVTDTVSPCFRITSLSSPSKGSATLLNTNTIRWQIDALGVTETEGATFEFTVEHIGTCSGDTEVNESISYTDTEGNAVSFPSPTVEVDCGVDICEERCREPVEVTVNGCEDTVEFDAGDICMEGLGRIIQLDMTLRNICPNKRVALAVFLHETDENGEEQQRGMKIMTIPAHTRAACQDITIRCITFVLPEDVSPTGLPCAARNFRARFIAHYIDNDYGFCCGENG